jgi:hypothetical protein
MIREEEVTAYTKRKTIRRQYKYTTRKDDYFSIGEGYFELPLSANKNK